MAVHPRPQAGADKIVDGIEERVEREDHVRLERVDQQLAIRQRHSIGFVTIAHTLFARYPKRAVLGFSLFIGQAFLYNWITFGFAQIVQEAETTSGRPGLARQAPAWRGGVRPRS